MFNKLNTYFDEHPGLFWMLVFGWPWPICLIVSFFITEALLVGLALTCVTFIVSMILGGDKQ